MNLTLVAFRTLPYSSLYLCYQLSNLDPVLGEKLNSFQSTTDCSECMHMHHRGMMPDEHTLFTMFQKEKKLLLALIFLVEGKFIH